jgi:hypothetical protein
MESHGLAGGIQVTQATYDLLKDKYSFWHRGKVFIKGRGEMDTYMLLDIKKTSSVPELQTTYDRRKAPRFTAEM